MYSPGPCLGKIYNQYKLGFKDHLHASSSLSNDDPYSISQILCICSNVSLTYRNIVMQLWFLKLMTLSLFTDIRV